MISFSRLNVEMLLFMLVYLSATETNFYLSRYVVFLLCFNLLQMKIPSLMPQKNEHVGFTSIKLIPSWQQAIQSLAKRRISSVLLKLKWFNVSVDFQQEFILHDR
uniref:Uncharacterized protein n=1 Tax=Octopus bimaculoides TaxID=37653 RepID=A0A0L8HV99_OCTBM